jgi:chromosomal replication initiation ATPase DnaA
MIVRHASRVVAAAASEAEPPVPVVATAEVIPFTDPRPITIATIRSAVAKYFGLTDAEILDPSPAPRFSRPRQLGMYWRAARPGTRCRSSPATLPGRTIRP